MRIITLILWIAFIIPISAQHQKFPVLELDYPDSLHVVKRAEWGSVPLLDTIKQQHEIKYITIHHAGVEFYDEDKAAENILNLQSWSRSEKKWIDIPYHFMIDLEGKIYEGRPLNYPGDTNTEYNPFNHALIEVMGNYEIQQPNEKQLLSLINLISFLVKKFHVSVNNIKTHKDYSNMTVCPGKNLYKYFENGFIISSVKRILAGKSK